MGHRLFWILEQISTFGVGGEVGATFEKSVKVWRRYAVAKERSSRIKVRGARGLGRSLKKREEGLTLRGSEGEGREETQSLLRGKGPETGGKERDEETKEQVKTWTWCGWKVGPGLRQERAPGRCFLPLWKVSSGFSVPSH